MYCKTMAASRPWPEALVTPEEIDALLHGPFAGHPPALNTELGESAGRLGISFPDAEGLHTRGAVSLAE